MHSVLSPYRDPGWERLSPASWLYIWGPALLAVAIIAGESTRTFSSENTSGWLRPLVEAMLGRLSDPGWAELHHLLRKTGHFCGFGGVCVTFVRAWLWRDLRLAANNVTRWRWRAVLRGVISTAAVATADEIHQTFLGNRTGKASDVVLDTMGGIAACAMLWAIFWRLDGRIKEATREL